MRLTCACAIGSIHSPACPARYSQSAFAGWTWLETEVRNREGGFTVETQGRWQFAVDTTPPRIGVPATVEIPYGSPVRIAGRIEPGATLTFGRRPVPVRDGRFAVRLRSVPVGPVVFRARDSAGNVAMRPIRVALVPRKPSAPVRAVHVTGYAWATPSLHDPVLRLADEHRIDAVELDLKDESGAINWNAPIPLARKIGAARKIYDLPAAIRLLHSKGVRVIGRIVAFRDPILASATRSSRRPAGASISPRATGASRTSRTRSSGGTTSTSR